MQKKHKQSNINCSYNSASKKSCLLLYGLCPSSCIHVCDLIILVKKHVSDLHRTEKNYHNHNCTKKIYYKCLELKIIQHIKAHH